jgi:hypothetical protein
MGKQKKNPKGHREEAFLLSVLKTAMTAPNRRLKDLPEDLDWERLFQTAKQHAVLPLLYDVLENEPLPASMQERVQKVACVTVLQSYRMLFFSRDILELLSQHGIEAVLLKGMGTARYYPVPELRKSGDIDLLLKEPNMLKKARGILLKEGFTVSAEQHANHHLVMQSPEHIDVEVHTMLAEPFSSRELTHQMEMALCEAVKCTRTVDVAGVELNVLSDAYEAYELLLHMLQHFLRAGFGLKLLCDWVAFWNRPVAQQEIDRYLSLIEQGGLTGFSSMVTSVCMRYLGLAGSKDTGIWREENAILYSGGTFGTLYAKDACRRFLEDVFEAEEFGKSSDDRMVALHGTKLTDYIREFHYQMKMNYLWADGKYMLYPFLWIATLARFLYNNRHVRNISAKAVLRKAASRSRLIKELDLFYRKDS